MEHAYLGTAIYKHVQDLQTQSHNLLVSHFKRGTERRQQSKLHQLDTELLFLVGDICQNPKDLRLNKTSLTLRAILADRRHK